MPSKLISVAAQRTETPESEWRMIGKAAVHQDVTPDEKCEFLGPAIIRGGVFHGGFFRDGDFHGGVWQRSPVFVQGTRYFVCESDGGNITSGCMTKTAEWWAENVRRTAEHNGYSPEQVDEYEAIFEFVILRINALGVIDAEEEVNSK